MGQWLRRGERFGWPSVSGGIRSLPRSRLILIETGLLIFAAVLPTFLDIFWTAFVTRILIISLLAISFDLVWSYAGILSFGQAVFFGTAAYCAALGARDLGITNLFAVLPISVLVGGLLSLLLASILLLGQRPPSLIFVSIGTLAASFTAERLARGWYYIGATNGIPSFPSLMIGRTELSAGCNFYYLALVVLLVAYVLCRILTRSQFGLALAGIRENEARVAFLGYRVNVLKALVFTFAGAIAGVGGCLYAFHESFVWPNLVGVVLSTQAVLYVVLGGGGVLVGGVIGVTIMETLSQILADTYPEIWPVVLGLLLLLIIVFRPTGLIGLLIDRRERIGSFRREFVAGHER